MTRLVSRSHQRIKRKLCLTYHRLTQISAESTALRAFGYDAAPAAKILDTMRSSKHAKRLRPSTYYQVAGLNLQREMLRLCTLPAFGGAKGPLALSPPMLAVRRAAARPRRNLGFAVPSERRISVTAYPGIRPGDAQETLLHELVHIAVGRRDRSWHGPAFKRTLKEAMRQAYGVSVGPARGSTHGAYAEALERRRRTLGRKRLDTLNPDRLAFETAA